MLVTAVSGTIPVLSCQILYYFSGSRSGVAVAVASKSVWYKTFEFTAMGERHIVLRADGLLFPFQGIANKKE